MNSYINTFKLKADAKKMLKGRYGALIVIGLILLSATALFSYLQSLFLVSFGLVDLESGSYAFDFTNPADMRIYIFAGIMLGCSLLSFILTSPLNLGVTRYLFNFASGKEVHVEEIFIYFSSGKMFKRGLFFHIRKALLQFFWAVVCFLPGFGAYIAGIYFSGVDINTLLSGAEVTIQNELAMMLVSLGSLLLFAGSFIYISITVKYFLADYILVSDDTVTSKMAISIAVRMMKGRVFQYIGFIFSFIGWILLSILTCGVLLLFTVPYIMVSTALFAKTVIDINLNPPPPPPFGNML